ENLDLVKRKLQQRGIDWALFSTFETLDAQRREHLDAVQRRLQIKNSDSKRVAEYKQRQKAGTASPEDLAEMQSLIDKSKEENAHIEIFQKTADLADRDLKELLKIIPNLPHDSVP